jgi:hypothetical protein
VEGQTSYAITPEQKEESSTPSLAQALEIHSVIETVDYDKVIHVQKLTYFLSEGKEKGGGLGGAPLSSTALTPFLFPGFFYSGT